MAKLVLLALWFCALSLEAAEVQQLVASKEAGFYRIEMDTLIDAPAEVVMQVLTDHNRLAETTDSLLENRIVQTESPSRHKVASKTELCVLVFCKTLQHVQWIEQLSATELVATMIPGESDFSAGSGHWQVTQLDDQARLRIELATQPNFWVPPLIGPWAIKVAMRREFRQMAAGIERVAQARTADYE